MAICYIAKTARPAPSILSNEAIDFYHAEQLRKVDEENSRQRIQEQLANATNSRQATNATEQLKAFTQNNLPTELST